MIYIINEHHGQDIHTHPLPMHPLKFIRIFYNNTWDETQNLCKFPQEFQKSHYGYIKGMQICEGYITSRDLSGSKTECALIPPEKEWLQPCWYLKFTGSYVAQSGY